VDDRKIAAVGDRAWPGVTQMTQVERPPPWQGRLSYRVLSLLVSAALLAAGIAIVYRRIDWRDVAAVWASLDPTLVALAMVVYWLQYPINSFRLHRVILWISERAAETPPFRFLFKLTCSAGFVAVAAPIGLAGDAAKIAALRVFANLSITDATRATLFDRVVGVQWMSLIGLATLPIQIGGGIGRDVILAEFALFAGLIAGVGILLVLSRALALIKHDFIDKLARVFTGYGAMLSPRRSAVQLAIALLNALSAWGALYLLLRAAGLSTDAWLVAGFIPLLQLVNSLPFLYMGWGGRELAMAATLGASGSLSANETLAVSLAWGVVLIVTGAVNGVFLLGEWQIARPASSADANRR
jgi:uncharacterized membrane protein YbhN (UPF0104 family)